MTHPLSSSRRAFLHALGVGAAALPLASLPGFVRAAGQTPHPGRTLILIELAGGNDGLNTIVPFRDPTYRALRPEIGLRPHDLITLDRTTGLHSAMRGLAHLWERGDVQIIEGVGYPEANRSHFRSIAIWNSGMGAQSRTAQGWVSRSLSEHDGFPEADAWGLRLGGTMGPLEGPGRFSALDDPDALGEALERLNAPGHAVRPKGATPLQHVMSSFDNAAYTGRRVLRKLEQARVVRQGFDDTDLGQQLATVAQLMEAGLHIPVLKVVHDGYDTHDTQPERHQMLLEDLSNGISDLARVLRRSGRWDDTCVVTYSEFGRTARENGSAGTDHGTAAPVLVAGGSVRGGRGGARPSLDHLVEDEMVFTTDYRTVYRALLSELWGIETRLFDVETPTGLQLLSA